MARRVSSPIFIGRRLELERLAAALAETVAGRAAVVLVGGNAGVGKTRLVDEFAATARATGARVIVGGCVPIGAGSLSYGPFVEAFRGVFGPGDGPDLNRLLATERGMLTRMLPGLTPSGMSSIQPAPPPDRERLLELLLRVFRRLAASAPVLFVVEDVHWADRTTLDALSFLSRSLTSDRVLLVVTYRTDDLRSDHPMLLTLEELDRARRVEWLELAAFSRSELDQLLAGILGHEADPALVTTIHARSGGNAYFAEELLALGGTGDTLPETLRAVMLARIDGLAAPTQALLRVASAAGPRIDGRLLAAVAGLDAAGVEAGLRDAVTHQILVPVEGAGELFQFRHALLGEVVYGDLLPSERIRLHTAFAETLADRDGNVPDRELTAELARHWRAARDGPRALAASVRAGLAALAANAHADAQAQLECALELWPGITGAEELAGMDRRKVLEVAAEAATHAGAATRAIAHLRAAIDLADARADPVGTGLLYERLGSVAVIAGDAAASADAYEAAVRLVPAGTWSAARARVLAGLARRRMLDEQWEDGSRLASEAIAVARRVRAPEIEADALATLGGAQGNLGAIGDALRNLRLGRDLGLQTGDVGAASRAWSNLASLQEGEACVLEEQAAADWDEQLGLGRSFGSWTRCLAVVALSELGRWHEADVMIEHLRLGAPEGSAGLFLELCRADLDVGRGDLEMASGRLTAARQSMGQSTSGQWGLMADHLEARVELGRGRLDHARLAAARAVGAFDAMPVGAAVHHCRVLSTALGIEAEIAGQEQRCRGRPDLAGAEQRGSDLLERARTLAASMTGDRAVHWRRPIAVAAICEAEWARLVGEPDAARWLEASAACATAAQAALRDYAMFRQAEAMLRSRRDRASAAAVLRAAHGAASAMGANPLRGQIEALARRGQIVLAPPSPADTRSAVRHGPLDGFGLTRRERAVLALVADGRTNRQIADALFIGERTAGIHVSNILGKLGVARRTEAAALVHRLDLGETPAR